MCGLKQKQRDREKDKDREGGCQSEGEEREEICVRGTNYTLCALPAPLTMFRLAALLPLSNFEEK